MDKNKLDLLFRTIKRENDKAFRYNIVEINYENKELDIVKKFIIMNPDFINMTNSNHYTLFYFVCLHGTENTVKYLMQNFEIDFNLQFYNKETVFYNCCKCNRLNIVKLFFKKKYLKGKQIDYNKVDNHNITPFWIACNKKSYDVVKFLLNRKRINFNKRELYTKYSPFEMVYYYKIWNIFLLFLSTKNKKINYNKKNIKGKTIFCDYCYNYQFINIKDLKLFMLNNKVNFNQLKNIYLKYLNLNTYNYIILNFRSKINLKEYM